VGKRGGIRKKPSGYRSDLEGLRGVAVLLVLLFHAHFAIIKGGFAGVDIFYVLSGFFITGLLINEQEERGRISLANFYARRIRRLMPAATLVLIVTLVASIVILPKLLIPGVAVDTAAAALFVANMNFAHHATDYFQSTTTPSPVLHYWSLSVEEQFYLIWPALFIFTTKLGKSLRRNAMVVMTTITGSSFAFAIYLLHKNAIWGFYSLPTRAWELGLGGILAVSAPHFMKIPRFIAATGSWLGIFGLTVTALFLPETALFPGIPALLPTLSTALIIICGLRGPMALLTNPITRYFGRISYSLYLWHWPILILPTVVLAHSLSMTQKVAATALSILLASLTTRWIEAPLRKGRLIGMAPRRNAWTAAASVILIFAASVGVHAATAVSGVKTKSTLSTDQKAANLASLLQSALPSPAPSIPPSATPAASPSGKASTARVMASATPAIQANLPADYAATVASGARAATVDFPVPADLDPSLLSASNDKAITYKDGCHTQTNQMASTKPCAYGDLNGNQTVVLFGDSHALSWFPAFNAVAKMKHWRLLSYTMSACTPADIPAYNPATKALMVNCPLWRQATIKRIAAENAFLVLIASSRSWATTDAAANIVTGDARTAMFDAGMKRTIEAIKPTTLHMVYLEDTPGQTQDPPLCLSQHPKSTLACATPASQSISAAWQAEEHAIASYEDIGILDPSYWVCPTDPCPVVIGNLEIFQDQSHLTATYSEAMAPIMASALQRAIS
jgi:peptidoglycan/LPS O-acetylase OafA/YrhL